MIKDYIYGSLTGNTSITSLIGTNIYYKILPELWNYSNPCIVYEVDGVGNSDSSTMRDMEEDSLVKIKIIGKTPSQLKPIDDLVTSFFKNDLTGLASYGCLLLFNSDTELVDYTTDTITIVNVFRGKYYR
jgi:hypothetical protein